ncbi:MAG: four helix bundle protein [Candidatus Omnitrophota bacterium]
MHWKDLKIWQKSHGLTLSIYKISSSFPATEKYSLTSQLRRSSISICANIVEGQSRNTTKEYINFLYNSRGSLEETRYQLLLATDLGYLDKIKFDEVEKNCEEISKMINSLINSLRKKL